VKSFSLAAVGACVVLLLVSLFLVAGLGSCAPAPGAAPTGSEAEPPAESSPRPAPTVTLAPSPTPAATAAETTLPLTTGLQALLEAGLAPASTPEANMPGVADPMRIAILPLQGPPGAAPLWAAYSVGLAYFEPEQNHFVAVFGYEQDRWQERGRVVLTGCAQYVGQGSLTQVEIEPNDIWLELQSGAGAHSGCYDLLRFDGRELSLAVSGFNSSPGAGWAADLNGDGNLEVVLDQTDPYVFCYACSVRLPQFQVLAWDGQDLAEVPLRRLAATAPQALRELNDRAVELAEGQLWRDAQAHMTQARSLPVDDRGLAEAVTWNGAIIDLHAEARREQAESGIMPILQNAFYGDYAAALEPMRAHGPDEIWRVQSPLISGTVAEGWEVELSDWLSWTTNLAVEAMPDPAPAYFLRGWAAFLRAPDDVSALDDVQRAAGLEPGDELYTRSAAHLRSLLGAGGDLWQPLDSESCYGLGQAMMQTLSITVTMAAMPFQDYIGGGSGAGCEALAKGTGLDFADAWSVVADIATMLEERGWAEAMSYAADGPTGTARGFHQGDALCLVSAGWQPAPEASCPSDRPIFECALTPEQQLYTVWLHCARPLQLE
jgi:hypothetical protein